MNLSIKLPLLAVLCGSLAGCGSVHVGPRRVNEHDEGWPRLDHTALEEGTPVILILQSGDSLRGVVMKTNARKIRIEWVGPFGPERKVLSWSDIARVEYDERAARDAGRAGTVIVVWTVIVGYLALTALALSGLS